MIAVITSKHLNKTKSRYVEASVVVPDFDARYSEVWGALGVPDDEVELNRRVERTRPHVTLFSGLSTQESRLRSDEISKKVVGVNSADGFSLCLLTKR